MEQSYKPKTYPFPNNWTESQYFIYACFVDDLQSFYKDYIEQGWKQGRFQVFDNIEFGTIKHKYWNPSKYCCETGELLTKDTMAIKIGYWTPNVWKPIRKDLRQNAMRLEAIECQKIDCSCNDCISLKRDDSYCLKKNTAIKINENLCHPQNVECFKHRKDE